MKEIITNGKRLLVVPVPENSYHVLVAKSKSSKRILMCASKHWHAVNNNHRDEIKLPKGDWQLLGNPFELSEKAFEGLVNTCTIRADVPARHAGFLDVQKYVNYLHEDQFKNSFNTAIESFHSLLKANGIYEVNPYGDKDGKIHPINAFNGVGGTINGESLTMNGYIKKYSEAQQYTNTVILIDLDYAQMG